MRVGQNVLVSWNMAKELDVEVGMGESMRVEAIGDDWIVLRDKDGWSRAATFAHREALDTFLADVEAAG